MPFPIADDDLFGPQTNPEPLVGGFGAFSNRNVQSVCNQGLPSNEDADGDLSLRSKQKVCSPLVFLLTRIWYSSPMSKDKS